MASASSGGLYEVHQWTSYCPSRSHTYPTAPLRYALPLFIPQSRSHSHYSSTIQPKHTCALHLFLFILSIPLHYISYTTLHLFILITGRFTRLPRLRDYCRTGLVHGAARRRLSHRRRGWFRHILHGTVMSHCQSASSRHFSREVVGYHRFLPFLYSREDDDNSL